MQKLSVAIALCLPLWGVGTAYAQTAPTPSVSENIVQLAATGNVEVQPDWLIVTLTTTREGKDATQAQAPLRQALDAALQEARRSVEAGQLEVQTGHFGAYPRYGQNGQISHWQGSAELVLQGRDFARITSTAARINSMVVGQINFAVSPELRAQTERQAQLQAIGNFKAQAADLTQAFGFSHYSLRKVTVDNQNAGAVPRPRVLAMSARSAPTEEAVPVEAGKTNITVRVSGTVQMR